MAREEGEIEAVVVLRQERKRWGRAMQPLDFLENEARRDVAVGEKMKEMEERRLRKLRKWKLARELMESRRWKDELITCHDVDVCYVLTHPLSGQSPGNGHFDRLIIMKPSSTLQMLTGICLDDSGLCTTARQCISTVRLEVWRWQGKQMGFWREDF